MSEIRKNLRKVAAGAACLAGREAVIAMEADTISKNGRSSKSHTSRKYCLPILLICFLLVCCFNAQAQSNNQKVDVRLSGNVYQTQTIRTIDYGALELANAQREANRLENVKYTNEEERRKALEIASNPVKAYDYGFDNRYFCYGKDAKNSGFKQYTQTWRVPHSTLFIRAGEGRYENVSSDGITTEIEFYVPFYNKSKVDFDFEKFAKDFEKNAKMENIVVGQMNSSNSSGSDSIFVHNKDINRATVYGIKGFKSTLVWEDDYQYVITDNYQSYEIKSKKGMVIYFVKVRTYGSKKEVTFEQLEGRRYYLRQLIEKVISTATVDNMKY